MIYSVKILIVIYWSAKAFNYAIYKHVSAAKLIYTLEHAEDLAECGCISRDKIGTWLDSRKGWSVYKETQLNCEITGLVALGMQ